MLMKLNEDFYTQKTLTVAQELLGQIFCRKLPNGTILKGKIVETEAYTQEEPSCHAFCGKTKRSETLFKKGGTLYVYFTYGMHHCVNIVTENENYGSAVLIRAIEPITALPEYKKTDGPAKLCKAFQITLKENNINICQKNSNIWVEKDKKIPFSQIIQTTRIGISKAKELNWRFYIKNNPYVSVKIKTNER